MRVNNFGDLKQPSDFYWSGGTLTFLCPCGCGSYLGATVEGPGAWKWNGNLDKPTLTPSIRFLAGCKWHGYLTDGVFKSC